MMILAVISEALYVTEKGELLRTTKPRAKKCVR